MHNSATRRTFLRGVGAALALPAFPSLVPPGRALAAAGPGLATTATGAPLRTAFLSFPNGSIPKAWWPEQLGSEFEFSPTLKSLSPLKDSLQVVKGLDQVSAEAGPDGGGDHARGNGTFLTGVRRNKSATDIRAGVSIDQVISQRIGHLTRFPSLQLASDPVRQNSNCDSGYSCAYQYNISWQSETTPMATETNPRQVFERLFGSGRPGERGDNLRRRRAEQRSILDFVREDARKMQSRLQLSDAKKLDQYLTGVRELEKRIERAESFGDPRDPQLDTPVGIPQSHEEYVSLMYELSLLALQTDSTRVLTLMLGHDGDNRSYDFIGISEGHHDLTHHQDQEDRIQKVAQIDAWNVQQFAKFLSRMQETEDIDGHSLLHNSMVLFGSGNADGNRHTHRDLPIILAGNGGQKLSAGRFVDHSGTPLTNLFLTMASTLGIHDLPRFGDSTGLLGNI